MQDRDEHTLELSLFAEAFQEMLARHFGSRILKALYMERQGFLCRSAEIAQYTRPLQITVGVTEQSRAVTFLAGQSSVRSRSVAYAEAVIRTWMEATG